MHESEQNIDSLERKVPELSAFAANKAYQQALNFGLSVVVSNNSDFTIVKIFPNGDREEIKKIEPPLKVKVGTVVQIP
jgi:hypothetical protein